MTTREQLIEKLQELITVPKDYPDVPHDVMKLAEELAAEGVRVRIMPQPTSLKYEDQGNFNETVTAMTQPKDSFVEAAKLCGQCWIYNCLVIYSPAIEKDVPHVRGHAEAPQ